MDIIVKDDFLDKEYFKNLQDFVLDLTNEQFNKGGIFPWHMSGVVFEDEEQKHFQFVHVVYLYQQALSQMYERLIPFFEKLGVYSLQRCKFNLTPRQEKIIEHGMHIDITDAPENALSSVLYMNTNNGYTKFESGEKVKSVENRLVTFPNELKHTGSTNSCDALFRCVMNVDWIAKTYDPRYYDFDKDGNAIKKEGIKYDGQK